MLLSPIGAANAHQLKSKSNVNQQSNANNPSFGMHNFPHYGGPAIDHYVQTMPISEHNIGLVLVGIVGVVMAWQVISGIGKMFGGGSKPGKN